MTDIETWDKESFEAKYRALMAGMSEADMKRSAAEVLHFCKCPRCPTNRAAEGDQAVYCTLGRRTMTPEREGCLCSTCAITKTMSLRWDYYCLRGSAVELSDLSRR
ncbi:MAG: DUF2769 domain-containing protein [Candidatus Thorarchaeota archaeon]